jgi:hypothetical protein
VDCAACAITDLAKIRNRKCAGCAFPSSAQTKSAASDREQQQERDQKRENAERFGHREAEDQTSELALDRRGIAQRAVQELAEQRADANAGRARSDRSEAGSDIFGGDGKLAHAVPCGSPISLAKIDFGVEG